ncbi:hypothetical protein RIF29_11462 [Crotalaria pallida]|uniref:Uncharacterized protein n=1 Tax=Crotalaria pallida TaxID=3830 RepID=A0AAN9IM51_CROPI
MNELRKQFSDSEKKKNDSYQFSQCRLIHRFSLFIATLPNLLLLFLLPYSGIGIRICTASLLPFLTCS